MITRCEYCGQLYDGLSCPYCCAPRGEQEPIEQKSIEQHSDIFGRHDCPEWILTNSSCDGNNNVQVIGDNNVVNSCLYAGNVPYYVNHDVWPEDEPSEHDKTSDAIRGTCTYDAQVRSQVKELAEEQAKKHRISLRWAVINLVCAWFGAFSLGVVIGVPVGFSIVAATVFCAVIGCCFVVGY